MDSNINIIGFLQASLIAGAEPAAGYGPDWGGLDVGEDEDTFSEYEDADTFVPIKRRSAKLTDLVGAQGERDKDNNLVVKGRKLGEVAMLRATDGKAASKAPRERKASRNHRKARR